MPHKAKQHRLNELAKASDHFPSLKLSCIDEEVDDSSSSSKATEFSAHRSFSNFAAFLVVIGIVFMSFVNPFFLLGRDANHDMARKFVRRPTETMSLSRTKVYSVARTDRGGSAIHEMLRYHAEAFARNMTYGGACVDQINWSMTGMKKGVFQRRRKERERLIATLGLSHQLPMACPSRHELASGKAIFLDAKEVKDSKDNRFTEAWLEYLQSQRRHADFEEELAAMTMEEVLSHQLQVVVHVRRGDVTPCKNSKRYLPNSYYLQVLDKYLPAACMEENKCNVTIFSEIESFESFEVFQQRGYQVALDSPLEEIWESVVSADVVVISRSSFSQVPAMFNKKTVIAPTLRPDDKMPHWIDADKEIKQTAISKREEYAAYCG